jgi:hypothetical protein
MWRFNQACAFASLISHLNYSRVPSLDLKAASAVQRAAAKIILKRAGVFGEMMELRSSYQKRRSTPDIAKFFASRCLRAAALCPIAWAA